MTKLISKTDFILYRECPNNVWIKIHRPDEYAKFEVSEFEKSLGKMGNEVEKLARGMFPNGVMVEGRGEEAQKLTKKLIAEKTPVIFQAVFATDKYLAATDVLVWNKEANVYDLYEIKMSSAYDLQDEETDDFDDEPAKISEAETLPGKGNGKPRKLNKKKEEQYEYDITFQVNVLEMCGTKINDKYLIRLNKEYKKFGPIDFTLDKLFVRENKSEAVAKLAPIALEEMERAYKYLSVENQPNSPCPCYYKGRSAHCTAFSAINTKVPKYSVHDLNRIGGSKALLRKLLDEDILEIDQIPEDMIPPVKKPKEGEKPSKPRKLNQVRVYKTKEPIIDLEAIRAELSSLTFPLYFLDYETYPTAIPVFDGYHPYQHIVFQYSLHVLDSKDAEPRHFECIVLEGDPAEKIVASLVQNIGPIGSVISWYKKFENSRNKELARLVPLQFEFLNSVIKRTYDLMDIVENQYYVHPGFYGRSSIKKVFPVVAPDEERSYKTLGVKNGMEAIEAYRQISQGELKDKDAEEKKAEMLEYCKLDTKAMYIIWKFFRDLVDEAEKE
ncbi:MAG: DUF2779 domain-containing protein [Minisyncoccia bacterium]